MSKSKSKLVFNTTLAIKLSLLLSLINGLIHVTLLITAFLYFSQNFSTLISVFFLIGIELFDSWLNPSNNNRVTYQLMSSPCYSLSQYLILKTTMPIVYKLCKKSI